MKLCNVPLIKNAEIFVLCAILGTFFVFAIPSRLHAESNSQNSWHFMMLRGSSLNADVAETTSFAVRDFMSAGGAESPKSQGEVILLEALKEIPKTHAIVNNFSWNNALELSLSLLSRSYKEKQIVEFAPSLVFRWKNNLQKAQGSFALSQGLSYASFPPESQIGNNQSQNLLHFALMEVSLSWADFPHWELLSRIHHRSGAWGLYGIGINSSNALGVGIRYR